jgi:hypothetical protein
VVGFAAALLISTASFAFPTARTSARMVFNEESQRLLLFGGLGPLDASLTRRSFGDTWEWTGRQWVQLAPQDSPEKRFGHVMVYDTINKRVVLFGGGDDQINYNDTWFYKERNWTKVDTPNAPSPRRYASAVFDPVHNKVVLYGGNITNTIYHDTWTFDGTTWTRVVENAPELSSSNMVYDEKRNEILLLGFNSSSKSEMYRFTGTSWEKLTPATLPECVRDGGLVYQKHNEKVLYVGGGCATGLLSDLTFEWDGTNWTKVETTVNAGTVSLMAIAYDPVRLETVLFGGTDFSERSLTYAYRDGVWRTRGDLFFPGPRSLFVFDTFPANQTAYLYGGQNERIVFNDLWRYDGGRWTPIFATDAPTSCNYPSGGVDVSRSRFVIVCEDSTTTEFDGEKFIKFPNLKDPPVSRRFSSMVYDEQNKKMVLYGGFDGTNYLRDTWTWNGTAWTHLDRKNSPPARMLGTMFYDPIQKKVMLLGGIGRPTRDDRIVRYDDMWSFNGTSWTQLTPATKPPARYGARAKFDPATGKVLLFGGKSAEEKYLDDQWLWDGTTWTKLETAAHPEARMNFGLTVDPISGKLVIYGGYNAGYFSDLWSFSGTNWQIVPERNGRTRVTVNPIVAHQAPVTSIR